MASQKIDIDELAKDKVEEIEKSLNNLSETNLETISAWFSILKQIITAADLHRTNDQNGNVDSVDVKKENYESIYADYADDYEMFNAIDLTDQFATNSVKWTIRVRAFKIVHTLVRSLTEPIKNSVAAKTIIMKQLPDLVRLSFVAATSPYDDLKMQGFEMFKFLINKFASVEEKEFPGHSILEQYKTQFLSALRPSFELDAPPYITAVASQICSLWICTGLENDLLSLKRTHLLMRLTIAKLENQSVNQNSKLYTESELEKERLDILGSWAQLYIATKDTDKISAELTCKQQHIGKLDSDTLGELIEPDIQSIVKKWWEALRDYALLIMPAPRIANICHENEHVYTREVALRLFSSVWPKLLLASTIRLSIETNANQLADDKMAKVFCQNGSKSNRTQYFKFICGIIMRELCRCATDSTAAKNHLLESTVFSIKSLSILVNCETLSIIFSDEPNILCEFYTVSYNILVNHVEPTSQQHSMLINLLNHIFRLVVMNSKTNPGSLRIGLTLLVSNIQGNLKHASDNPKNENSVFYASKMDLSILVTDVVIFIESSPDLLDDTKIRDTIIDIFKRVISLKEYFNISVCLLDRLCNLKLNEVALILEAMFDTQLTAISTMIGSIGNSLEKKTSVQFQIGSFIKFTRISIDKANDEIRIGLVSRYLIMLVDCLRRIKISSSEGTVGKSANKRNDSFDLIYKCIRELKQSYPKEFEIVKDPELDLLIAQFTASQVNQKNEINRAAQTIQKSIDSGKVPKKPTTKIMLKSDFSNFYVKK